MNFAKFVCRLAGPGLLSAMLLLNCPQPAGAQSQAAEGHGGPTPSIEGAWLVTIDIPVARLSFTAITTFAAGGVSASTGALDRLAQNSPLYGSWKQSGENRFDRTVYFFQFDSIGNPLRMLKNKEVYRLKGRSEFECEGRQYACDLDGKYCVDQNTPFTAKGRLIGTGQAD